MVPLADGFSNPLPFNAMIGAAGLTAGGIAGSFPLPFASRPPRRLSPLIRKGDQ